MSTGDQYRIKAAEFHAESQRIADRSLRRQFEDLSRAYLRLADQADRNASIELVYEPPPPKLTDEPDQAGIAQNIERYNVAYRLAWKHISERQKREHPNVAKFLHDVIRQQLKEGAAEPLFIAAEALKNVEKLTGQIDSDEEPIGPADDRNNRLRRALRFVTDRRI